MVPKPENCDQNNVKIDILFEKLQKLFSGWGVHLQTPSPPATEPPNLRLLDT